MAIKDPLLIGQFIVKYYLFLLPVSSLFIDPEKKIEQAKVKSREYGQANYRRQSTTTAVALLFGPEATI